MAPKVYELFLNKDNTIDVLSSQSAWDYELFFGPVKRPLYFFETKNDTLRISEILLALELATTRTWCRKNNWDWLVGDGYKEIEFGKLKIKLCILLNPPKRYTVEEIDEIELQYLLKGE